MSRALATRGRAEEWAQRISTQQAKSVDSIIEVGRLLVKARADLVHGEWGRLFSDELIAFSQGTAERLMAIADHSVLGNSAHAPNLPPSWMTLYELTKVDPTTLKNALKDGVITPDMPRKAVKALMPASSKQRHKPELPDIDVEPVAVQRDWADATRVAEALRPAYHLVHEWPDGRSMSLFIHEVRQLLKHVERLEERRHVEVSA